LAYLKSFERKESDSMVRKKKMVVERLKIIAGPSPETRGRAGFRPASDKSGTYSTLPAHSR
jgi:hypothetical protein